MSLLLLIACGNRSIVDAQLSPTIASVIQLNWQNPEALQTYVRFGLEDELIHQSPVSPAQIDAEVFLLGMPASTEVFYEVINATDESVIADGHITTGSLPKAFRPFDIQNNGGPGWTGYLVSNVMGSTDGPIIIDNEGNIVWWFDDTAGWGVTGARLSHDHQWVIYLNQYRQQGPNIGELVKVSIDGKTVQRWELPGIHHDFVELPDGSITVMSEVIRLWEDRETTGDVLLNVQEDGTFTEVWNIFRDLPEANWSTDREDDGSDDWSHGNAIDYDINEEDYLISFRNFSTILDIDAASRQRQWALGGQLSDYTITGDEQGQFNKEHQFERLEDGILVFDDGDPSRGWSRAVEYQFDGTVAEESWEYIPEPKVQSLVLGDVHRLENGNTLITFSIAGQIDVVNPQKELLWRLNSPLGYAIGYGDRVDSLYADPSQTQ